jgi:hypothetical protein
VRELQRDLSATFERQTDISDLVNALLLSSAASFTVAANDGANLKSQFARIIDESTAVVSYDDIDGVMVGNVAHLLLRAVVDVEARALFAHESRSVIEVVCSFLATGDESTSEMPAATNALKREQFVATLRRTAFRNVRWNESLLDRLFDAPPVSLVQYRRAAVDEIRAGDASGVTAVRQWAATRTATQLRQIITATAQDLGTQCAQRSVNVTEVLRALMLLYALRVSATSEIEQLLNAAPTACAEAAVAAILHHDTDAHLLSCEKLLRAPTVRAALMRRAEQVPAEGVVVSFESSATTTASPQALPDEAFAALACHLSAPVDGASEPVRSGALRLAIDVWLGRARHASVSAVCATRALSYATERRAEPVRRVVDASAPTHRAAQLARFAHVAARARVVCRADLSGRWRGCVVPSTSLVRLRIA